MQVNAARTPHDCRRPARGGLFPGWARLWLAVAALLAGPWGGLSGYDMPVKLPGAPARLRWPLKPPGTEAAAAERGLYLQFSAYTTTGTVKPVVVSIEFVNGRGEWYQTARNLSIGFNAPRSLVLDLSADSADWIPSGHFRPWDAQALEGLTAFEFRVSASEPIDLTVHFTPPVWHSGAPAAASPPGLVAAGVDGARQCVRLMPVAGSGEWTLLRAHWPQATVAGFPREAFVAGAVSGEWHPVGGVEWAWHPPPAGGVGRSGPIGYGPPARVVVETVNGRSLALGTIEAFAGLAAASSGDSAATMPPATTPSGTPPTLPEAEGPTRPSPVAGFGASVAQLLAAGRPLVGIAGPEPALTGQPAHWWRLQGGKWLPTVESEPCGPGWAWRAPNFAVDAHWVREDRRPDSACLDGQTAWAWEEALVAAKRLEVQLPALVWGDRDVTEHSAFRWGLNPWQGAAVSPGLLFADGPMRARQRAAFQALVTRFSAPGGVQDWRVGLTWPLAGETALTEVYGWDAAALPDGTAVRLSHPACLGEAPAPWTWQAGRPNWALPAGWKSIVDAKRYTMAAPVVAPECVLISAPGEGGSTGVNGLPATARLVLRADPLAKDGAGRFADNLAGGAYLDLDLEAVGLGPEGRVAVDIVTGDWVRYHALSPALLSAGQRQRVRIALGDDSPLTPVQWELSAAAAAGSGGGSRPSGQGNQTGGQGEEGLPAWRGYRMRRIREIVVSFHRAKGKVQAKLYGMAIHPTRPGAAEQEPAVTPWPTAANALTAAAPAAAQSAAMGELRAFDAQVAPEPINPYNLEEVDLRLAITPAGNTGAPGETVEVPAFWYEPERLGVRTMTIGGKPVDAEEIAPEGVGRFRALWRPAGAGSYSLEWRLYRGSHFTVAETKVYDYRYNDQGEGRPFPRKDYMERALNDDNRNLQTGPKLYGAEQANRPVERLSFVDGTVAARAVAGTVTVAGGAPPKYVRIAPGDPGQFELTDGSPYYPIGVNARSPSDARVPFKIAKNGRYDAAFFETLDKRATRQFDDFFASYATHGINWARVWMASWWLALEWRRDFPGYGGVGDYNQQHAARLDHLLAEAERQGIYLQVTLNNHGMYSPEIDTQWADNPYNAELGGPCASMQDFFSRAEPQKWHLMRLRYIAARWGQSPAVHGWEICSEVEFVGEYSAHYFDYERGMNRRSAKVLDDWHVAVAAWLKRWDVEGRHLVTTHYSHPYQGQSTLALKAMEVPMANAYSAYPDLYSTGDDPKNQCRASVAADAYWNGFKDPNSQGVFAGFKQFGKPVLVGEHGRHWMGVDMRYKVGTPNTPENLEADMHCMLWAMHMRPYAGDTGFWWWLPLQFEDGWLEHYAGLAAFAKGEDRRGRRWDQFDGKCDREALQCMALFDRQAGCGYAWVFEKSLEQSLEGGALQKGVQVTLPLGAGEYTVEFWHTRADDKGAQRFATQTVKVGDPKVGLVLAMPEFKGDVALKVCPVEAARPAGGNGTAPSETPSAPSSAPGKPPEEQRGPQPATPPARGPK